MCFAKSAPAQTTAPAEPQDPVIQHEADASLTKNTKNINNQGAFKQNIKTSALGLDEQANTAKKTLLGE